MTCSLVVNSKSGNTRMVSGAIKRALQVAGVEFVHAAALSDDADADQVALDRAQPDLHPHRRSTPRHGQTQRPQPAERA